MQLRDYQIECIEKMWSEIKEKDSALVVAPTGSGKTIIFTKFIELCTNFMKLRNREFSALVLVHKIDLVQQTIDKLKNFY